MAKITKYNVLYRGYVLQSYDDLEDAELALEQFQTQWNWTDEDVERYCTIQKEVFI